MATHVNMDKVSWYTEKALDKIEAPTLKESEKIALKALLMARISGKK